MGTGPAHPALLLPLPAHSSTEKNKPRSSKGRSGRGTRQGGGGGRRRSGASQPLRSCGLPPDSPSSSLPWPKAPRCTAGWWRGRSCLPRTCECCWGSLPPTQGARGSGGCCSLPMVWGLPAFIPAGCGSFQRGGGLLRLGVPFARRPAPLGHPPTASPATHKAVGVTPYSRVSYGTAPSGGCSTYPGTPQLAEHPFGGGFQHHSHPPGRRTLSTPWVHRL